MKTTKNPELTPTLAGRSADPLSTDEHLMELVQAGNRDGLGLLHERHAPFLKQIGRGVLHNDTDVDDLLQDVFVEIWNRAASYNPTKGHPIGWMVTLARRRAIDRVRRREAYSRFEERLSEETKGHSDGWSHVHEDVAQRERTERLERALAVLPAAQRDAVQLAFHGQMTQREIAEHTGLPLGTVKTRLELGIKKMAASLRGFEDLLESGTYLASGRI
jgi:RNA polymerase sigma-70 factor (ECF subfamily)